MALTKTERAALVKDLAAEITKQLKVESEPTVGDAIAKALQRPKAPDTLAKAVQQTLRQRVIGDVAQRKVLADDPKIALAKHAEAEDTKREELIQRGRALRKGRSL